MTYELAKQLKDSGFQQWGTQDVFINEKGENDPIDGSGVYVASLAELIEACGDKFLALQHAPFKPTMPIPKESMPQEWMEMGGENRGTHFSYQQGGYTSEEAVARLWLALHTEK